MTHDFRWQTEDEPSPWEADTGDAAERPTQYRPVWQDDWLPFLKKSAVGFGIVAMTLALWSTGKWLVQAAGPQDVRIELQGAGVSHLKAGARVVLGATEVGRVERVGQSSGEPTALLRVDRDFVSQIPHSSRFEVDSLNDWLPGNLGVRVFPALTDVHAPLAEGARVRTSPKTLPPWVPWRFYIVLAAVVVVLAGVTVVAWVMRQAIMLIVVAGLIAGIILFLNGTISPP